MSLTGIIDGTYVAIQAPEEASGRFHEANYYCHKNFHALNVMVVSSLSIH